MIISVRTGRKNIYREKQFKWRLFIGSFSRHKVIFCLCRSKAEMSNVDDVIREFTEADNAIRTFFPKVDPFLVVSLIFDKNANKKHIYTLEIIMKPDQDKEAIREDIINRTGMTPSFYLRGTKMIVSHTLDLEFLKWINDQDGIISIKGSKFSAGGSSDF